MSYPGRALRTISTLIAYALDNPSPREVGMSRLKLALCVGLLGVVVTTAVAVAGGRS